MAADAIAAEVLRVYGTLPRSAKTNRDCEWTLLAGVVLEKKGADVRVLALGTGSKCLGRSEMSPKGDLLNDSHAEVMARRGLMRYLYSQIRTTHQKGQSDVFSGMHPITQRCQLREDVQFHMFLSHTPCGDASVGCASGKRSAEEEEESVSCKKAKLEGEVALRTGAKVVEGGKEQWSEQRQGVVRTKPGRGEPTLSLSCSDKLARWKALGMQGALLSLLMDRPVRLNSIVLAANCPFSENAMRRALETRIEPSLASLPSEFGRPVALKLLQATLPFPDGDRGRGGRPSPASAVWCALGKGDLEVAVRGRRQGITKSNLGTAAARLRICKLELLRDFITTLGEIQSRGRCIEHLPDVKELADVPYEQVKNRAEVYKGAWQVVKTTCFSDWPVKPASLVQFCGGSD